MKMLATIRAGKFCAFTAAAPSHKIATYVHASGADTIGMWMSFGYVECLKYSEMRLKRLMISTISAIQNLPRTHSIMKPNVRRLCCKKSDRSSAKGHEVKQSDIHDRELRFVEKEDDLRR